ncbi:MAG: GFA family protein [Pseudomonadota bacterium]
MGVEGSCLCGAVRYRVNGALGGVDHCHCSMCRRQHGAAFATYADCDVDAFSWIAGEHNVAVYHAAGGGGWAFCRQCGSTLAGTDEGEVTSVALGTVEGDPGVRADCHIYTGSKAVWYDIEDNLPQYDTRPDHDGDQP